MIVFDPAVRTRGQPLSLGVAAVAAAGAADAGAGAVSCAAESMLGSATIERRMTVELTSVRMIWSPTGKCECW